MELSKELEDLQRQLYHKQMSQQVLAKRKDTSQTHTGSGIQGHYNPYISKYVSAPVESMGEHSSIGQCSVEEEDYGLIDLDVMTFSDDDFIEPPQPAVKKLPSSNFQTKATIPKDVGTEFQQASSVMNQSSGTIQHVGRQSAGGAKVPVKRGRVTDCVMESPCDIVRKKQGESIVKSAAQNEK